MSQESIHFWLREEVKPGERRSPITPEHAKVLIEANHKVSVESSKTRCFSDDQFRDVGCSIVPSNSWKDAPKDAVILGLKELPDDCGNLEHDHIFFAHCFKGQDGSKEILSKFKNGGGRIFDLEFITHENGRRVAAFGRSAGIVGMAVGLLTWACQKQGKSVPPLTGFYPNSEALSAFIKSEIDKACEISGLPCPKAMVIGALGRCGSGARHFASLCNIETTDWDLEETKGGGPFEEILDHEIFVNSVLLMFRIPPFITKEMVERKERKLSVVVDVSCDVTNPHNPIPIYEQITTFTKPTVRVVDDDLGLDVVAIDHLPSYIPNESSQEFSTDLIDCLCKFSKQPTEGPWRRTLDKYEENLQKYGLN